MMDYEIFKEVVKESFLSYMPKGYQDMEVRVTPVDKVSIPPIKNGITPDPRSIFQFHS